MSDSSTASTSPPPPWAPSPPTVSGTNYLGEHIIQNPSSTVGILATIRYTKSPFIGFEGNFNQARYTENFNLHIIAESRPVPTSTQSATSLISATSSASSPTPPPVAGTMGFHPTRGGGQGVPFQYRAVYYYNLGVDRSVFSEHFGLRVHVRQAFYKAPDFLTNYLTIQQAHTNTLEPGVGFYLKF